MEKLNAIENQKMNPMQLNDIACRERKKQMNEASQNHSCVQAMFRQCHLDVKPWKWAISATKYQKILANYGDVSINLGI